MGLLVLSRKVGERILIGKDIAIMVVRIGPDAVRLGIEAPREMNVVRDELRLEEIAAEALREPVSE